MAKHHSGKEEVELSKFEKLLQVCDIAREQYYQNKFGGTKENNIAAASFQYSSSVPKDVGTSSFLKPQDLICFGEQVPRRSPSKATGGEPSLSSSFCQLNLKGCVDDHDYLKDKEVPSRFCMFNGKRYGEDHDYLNDEKVLLDRKGKKKLRNYYDDDEDCEYSEKVKKPAGYNIIVKNKVIDEIAPLPLEFENRIEEMGGDDVKLIIQKQMFAADADKTQNRLSIPIKQIREDAKGFLTKDEIEFLPYTVPLIEPNLNLTLIVIRKWNYTGTSSSYTLSGPWTGIRKRNNLRAGMVMQLWSFRVDGTLHLALVKVSRDNERDHGINGIANTSKIHAESHDQQHMMRKQVKSGNEADRQGAWASCSQAQGCSSYKSYSNQLDDID